MVKCVAILGSTGSIGRQSLEVCEELGIKIGALCCHHNTDLLLEQIEKFHVTTVAVFDAEAAAYVKQKTSGVQVYSGMGGICKVATLDEVDCVVTSMVGSVGLRPTLEAIQKGKRIGLANKETLVCAGEVIMGAAKKYGAQIVPVDSEHSAIFQCLQGSKEKDEIERLILTCSGGPFFEYTQDKLKAIGPENALKHPNWSMGAKITIDSATLMNKGLEVIEAMHLYGMDVDKVDAVIHRQSIVHSLVEFRDGAMLAQLGMPNMKLPIQYAFTYPQRLPMQDEKLDLLKHNTLTFDPIDGETFRLYSIARKCAPKQDTCCAIMNAANEEAVYQFLKHEIGFLDIAAKVEDALNRIETVEHPTLEDILEADAKTRELFRRP